MTQYENLDNLIMDHLIGRRTVSLTSLSGGSLAIEVERIAAASGREAFRVIDARLQYLRKRKVIRFHSQDGARGWELNT